MYRSDIDGLRAVAVLPVLLFHFGLSAFSGGYVGVDIFFVISGYLITSIIVKELSEGHFTITRFYERRVRRIFPALFVVLLFTVVTSYYVLLPSEFKDFGQSVFATAIFASNILFWIEAGYFDAESLVKPLLHTWSLAVEEQYYLFYPLLLIVIFRFVKNYCVGILVVIALISFVWSIWATEHYPGAAFFLAPSRFWELLIGSLLAVGNFPAIQRRWLGELLATTGFLFIAYAVTFFDHITQFPGPGALLPSLGAALIIYVGESRQSLINRMLGLFFFRHIGLISYSLYLWHWPLYIFTYLYIDRPLVPNEVFGLLFASYVMALISWQFVESPFRGRQSTFTRKDIFRGASLLMGSTMALGFFFHISGGLPIRFSEEVLDTAQSLEVYHSYHPQYCLVEGWNGSEKNVPICTLSNPSVSNTSYLFWGDSHASALVAGFKTLGSEVKVRFIGMLGCPPLRQVSVARGTNFPNPACGNFNERVLQTVLADSSIKQVVLAANWPLYAEGRRPPTDPNHGNLYLVDMTSKAPLAIERNYDILWRGLSKMVNALLSAGKKVVLVGPVPEIGINGASSLSRMKIFNVERESRPTRQDVDTRIKKAIKLLDRIKNNYNVLVFYPHKVLCGQAFCEVTDPGGPYYLDRHHLSPVGAEYIVEKLNLTDALMKNALQTF